MMQIELQKHIASLSSEEFEGFLSNIKMIPLLTIEEEIELIRRIRKGGSEAERAKELLAKTNLRYYCCPINAKSRFEPIAVQ